MMQCWINGPATGENDDKIKLVNILLIRLGRTTIPLLHFRVNSGSPKNFHIFSRLYKFRDVTSAIIDRYYSDALSLF
jgi:hypothetical protein